MARSNPRAIFGVHSFTPYSRSTGLPYGDVRILEGSTLSMSAELIELMGGSSKYPWAIEDGPISLEISLKASQYEDFMFELFLGKAPTAVSTEASGNVSTLTNKYGTSVMNASTGIASVSALAGSEADLKFGKYVIKAASATTVDVYILSDVDISRGTNGTIQNDALKVSASAFTITMGANTTITSHGVKMVGGSGTIGMTTGDTATFEVRPIGTGGMTVDIGAIGDTFFPEFGSLILAQKNGAQEMVEVDVFRCKGAGMPIGFDMNAFSKYEIKIKPMLDSTLNKVFSMRAIKASGT